MLSLPDPAAGGIPDKAWQPHFVTLETRQDDILFPLFSFKFLNIFPHSMGEITVELYWKHAPNTCRNFAELSRRGYYNNVVFHRIIRDFMIQGGDPTGTGRGGTSIYGAEFGDELHGDLKHTGAGILSMANSGPDTNGSQFFITLAPTQWLDGKHTIFGRVYTGMEVVKRIGMVETDKNDRPVDPLRIVKAKVDKL
ncbi:hypothetical protein KR074_001075 [Drosophila pseudoananassae]|nr:hypothetical protein KR074_001075 [Drosophila pseudoananassae]